MRRRRAWLLLACVCFAWTAGYAQDSSTLTEAILWRWPGARVVVRGGVLDRWDGPMAQPSPAEISQAMTDYALVAADARLAMAGKSAVDDERLTSAVVWTILKQMYPADTDAQTKTKYGVARQRIIDAYKLRPWQ